MTMEVRGLDNGQRAALLISECQRGVLDPDLAVFPGLAEQAAERAILPRIADLASVFRELGLPVVHIHMAARRGQVGRAPTTPIAARSAREQRMEKGTADVESMPEIAPQPADIVSTRTSGIGMWYGTDLDSTLRNLGIETIVLVGVSTNIALFAASVEATDRGYRAVIAEDATAGATREVHEWMVANTLPLVATLTTSAAVADTVRHARRT